MAFHLVCVRLARDREDETVCKFIPEVGPVGLIVLDDVGCEIYQRLGDSERGLEPVHVLESYSNSLVLHIIINQSGLAPYIAYRAN